MQAAHRKLSPLRLALIVGGLTLGGLVVSCIGIVVFFEIAGSNPEIQERVRGTATAEVEMLLTAQAQVALDIARLDAAELVLEETFDGPDLALALDPSGLTSDGEYNAYFSLTGFQFAAWDEPLTDFVAELDCKVFGRYGACGIYFGGQPGPDGTVFHHAFYLTGGGYGYQTWPPEGLSTSTEHSTLVRRPGEWNRLRVVRVGEQVWYTLNDQELEYLQLEEPELLTGEIGILTGLLGGGSATDRGDVSFDNFVLRRIP